MNKLILTATAMLSFTVSIATFAQVPASDRGTVGNAWPMVKGIGQASIWSWSSRRRGR